jgi:hypothetical protein
MDVWPPPNPEAPFKGDERVVDLSRCDTTVHKSLCGLRESFLPPLGTSSIFVQGFRSGLLDTLKLTSTGFKPGCVDAQPHAYKPRKAIPVLLLSNLWTFLVLLSRRIQPRG